ncbi:MAG: RNA polymerase sigma factor [Crocinitomicaceae bacterium]|nr:RNA polymerase sigma factor [Crocinitomicaceae bacterium]
MTKNEYDIAVKEHANALYGFGIKFLRDSENAQDIVQDVFEKLWINRSAVEFRKAKSWMFTTAYHAILNFIKRRKRMDYDSDRLPEKGEVANFKFVSNEVVERAISILPPLQKSIILLRDLEGYSYQEIGDILEISDSQVKVYLFRARNKIKKQLKDSRKLV